MDLFLVVHPELLAAQVNFESMGLLYQQHRVAVAGNKLNQARQHLVQEARAEQAPKF
jgi:hypothetical protein